MKEKTDSIVKRTSQEIEIAVLKRIRSGSAFSEDDFSTILRDHFTKAFEEADDDIMQIALHRGFSLIFHPDKIKNSEFKYRHYIEEQNWGQIPQQVLNSLSGLKIERPPKFWENPQGWFKFIIFDLYLKITLLKADSPEHPSVEQKKLEHQLEKTSFLAARFYYMLSGLDVYFQPVRFLFKTVFFLFFIPSAIGLLLLCGVAALLGLMINLPKRLVTFLMEVVTDNQFKKEIEQYKTSIREEMRSEVEANIQNLTSATGIDVSAFMDADELINQKIDQALASNSLLYLKMALFGIFHALFRNISGESNGRIALFVISFPFRFVAAIILFSLAVIIELMNQLVKLALTSIAVITAIANVALLFTLNLPRYIFFEIPRALINWIKSEPKAEEVIYDDEKTPLNLTLEYHQNPTSPPVDPNKQKWNKPVIVESPPPESNFEYVSDSDNEDEENKKLDV